MENYIMLSHGSGGKKTSELINSIIVPKLGNSELDRLDDGAYIDPSGERMVFSTDSFVVKPLFFPGGNIGKLSVCGTVNDISVCGGIPKFLSLSFIMEEGFELSALEKIVSSIMEVSEKCGVKVVTGDTKVVEKGRGDGIYINTSGIGFVDRNVELGTHRVRPGDKIIVSGTVGDHGMAILSARENLLQSGELKSDCAAVTNITSAALKFGSSIKIMRDPTRGGLATTLNEFTECGEFGIKIYEDLIPVNPAVRAAGEILGIDPLYSACEGRVLIIAASEDAEDIVNRLKLEDGGSDSAIIGDVTEEGRGRLLLDTGFGSTRILDKLTGSQLPRIC